ncbi:MAG: ABC transporter substrate-binding protein [Chitinispirillia bacterium]|jgi:polar amino acid transport system substrate-binding protein
MILKKVQPVILSVFFIFCPFLFAGSVDELVIITETYPPFNFEQEGNLQGISVDIMGLILKKVDSKLTIKNIQLLPWSRGYKDVQNVKNTCLFSTTRTKERENLFKWVGPIISNKNVLIALKANNIKIRSIDDCKKYKIGVVSDDIGEQLLLKEGFKKEALDRIGGTTAITQSIQKLIRGRIDMFSYSEAVVQWEIKNLKKNPGDFETVYTLSEGQLYYAFHKETSDEIISQMQGALDKLKKGAKINGIIKKYTE